MRGLERRATVGLTGVLALLLATFVLAGPAQAAPGDFVLRKTADNEAIAPLDDRLPNISVPDVVADGNRNASRCSPSITHLVAAICWNSGDQNTSLWMPQAVTSTGDAYGSGSYEGAEAVVASWYDKSDDGIDKGVRVSFIDWSNASSPTYRHVLLVEPFVRDDGEPDFRPVKVHAGGMFWYGHHLYVADTWNGFRVFDMRHIWRTATGDKSLIGLQSDGSYHAFDYKYVLPQAFSYQHSTTGGQDPIRFSFVSLDRTSTPDSIVAGEYDSDGPGTRLIRWEIDYTNRLLHTDDDGNARATEVRTVGVRSMQGATSIGDTYHISRSNGSGKRGDYATWTPGNYVEFHNGALPVGPEDLSYWEAENEMWSQSEYAGRRYVYAVRPSAF